MPEIVVGRSDDDMMKYGTIGTIPIGKNLVGKGEEIHTTTPILVDVMRPHMILISGKKGSGKSFSIGIFAEELSKTEIRKNICSLIIDTQGIFWTMKSPDEKSLAMLSLWGMKPKGFNVNVCVPYGQAKMFENAGVEFDESFSFKPSEISIEEWLAVFGLAPNSLEGSLLQKMFSSFPADFDLNYIITYIDSLKVFEKEKIVLKNYFESARGWGIFGESKMPKVIEPAKITVIDVSLTPDNVRALLISLILTRLFNERVIARRREEYAKVEMLNIAKTPLPWVFIDEAHNFLPATGVTASTNILNRIVKEGRQPGISLVLATQRPEKLHADALAQSDFIISHRLTAKSDIESLRSIMQTYMLHDIEKYINELPHVPGSAIILDDNSERIYKVQIRPRQSWHAGSSPIAL